MTFEEFWKKETDREPDFTQDRDFDARVCWQAGYAAGKERAAEIAETKGMNQDCLGEPIGWYVHRVGMAEDIAEAIRRDNGKYIL